MKKQLFKTEHDAASFLPHTKVISIEVHEEHIPIEEVKSILQTYHFDVTISGELLIGINQKLIL